MKSATWWLLHLLENPDAEVPTQAEYVVDVANTEQMREIMEAEGKGFVGGMRFMATVTNIEPTGVNQLAFGLAEADNVVLRIADRSRTPFGSRFEQIIGKTVVFEGFPQVSQDRLVLSVSTGDVLMFPVTGYLPPERLWIAEPSIQPVSELPVHQGDPFPSDPPNREDVEAAFLQRLGALFRREASSLRCSISLDDRNLDLRHEESSARGDARFPHITRVRVRLNLIEGNVPRGYVIQSFNVRDLDWHAPSIYEVDSDCLMLRVPVQHPGASVMYTSGLWGEGFEESRSEFTLRVTNADAAARIIEAMRDYLAPHRERVSVARSD